MAAKMNVHEGVIRPSLVDGWGAVPHGTVA